ncbi:SpaA isopeptide-forming pilin-related protein [Pseudobutyrivibrio xylanivorans]|uniref:LPXTG cell wall anchor domain-containing protein n=1 Tax=Pseudobutyrivibrio xylanivorans TaxID=185007 RepID=A0A5P6VU12_PSEXY|nr:SpaA isopeptide-forming pilin-related protein [Pseudobutyrivibrio xylanivorans]QFJ55920.1 LPXTG cell wall anchor domain-containing protein [Pseudobutyrivibrio xylanivorans]
MYVVERSGNLYNITSSVNDDGTTRIVAAFNAHALKSYIKNQLETMGLGSSDVVVSLNYTAVVTDKIQINSDENINTASVRFEKSTGDVDSTSDVVYGYTYGLKVVKKDGNETDTFLAGAQFRLFKEQDIYIKHSGDEDFAWSKRIGSDAVEAPDNALAYAVAKDSFDDTGINSGVYLLHETFDGAGTTESGVDYVAGDEICRLFVVYDDAYNTNTNTLAENGEFTSVATAEGILLTGLGDGTYIMAEIKAPNGYNELAEDMMFTIYRMDDEEAAQYHHGNLRNFYEKAADGTMEINESGMIALTVLNYKGLVLPSTGGMGTLIFTILGVIIMGGIIVVLIVRRRNNNRDFM